ncbi:gas vesicle protein GvpO [Actinophytocola sp. KF-1]
MATDAKNAKDDAEKRTDEAGDRDTGQKPSASRIAAQASDHISALTAKSVVGVTSVEPADQGWLVEVEVIEDARVPSSSDVLALYEAELNEHGDLLSYRRTRRYPRGSGDMGRS